MKNTKLVVALFSVCLLANFIIDVDAQTKHRRTRSRTPKVASASTTTLSQREVIESCALIIVLRSR